ncbi:hypothetical protein GCM10022262_39710 [Georgenia daeguensis]|uniref:ATP-dependent DNA ligase family profile domain-containing protein n=1 Tax=Georgenia daeguensis TaxID=908355 RepID=A0ABP6UM88_9MICO
MRGSVQVAVWVQDVSFASDAPMQISPTTTDYDHASRWLDEMHVNGVEGLVLKGPDRASRS